MDVKNGVWAIILICALILMIGFLKKKAELLLNFIMRAAVGTAGIYFLNDFLAQNGIDALVGINPFNIITVGTLGAGGFGLLYGITFFHLLY